MALYSQYYLDASICSQSQPTGWSAYEPSSQPLIPAKAGTQAFFVSSGAAVQTWVPASAGMSVGGVQRVGAPTAAQPFRSSYRSRQPGLKRSISAIFQARFHFFIRRSRSKAASRVSWASYQTRMFTPYLAVKPERSFSRCVHVREAMSSVEPM